MSFELKRHFTNKDQAVEASIAWTQIQGVEAPSFWSENAVEIAASKYFRRRQENSVRQLVQRVTSAIRQAGEWQGYFHGEAAQVFEDELRYVLYHQMASFNSPVYFNVGVFTSYGQLGTNENFRFDREKGQVVPVSSAYLHPQSSACFIQSVDDDLLSIFDLLKNEAKLFKYGSGTGTNFSRLRARGEPLDSGGESTGLISYLEVFDKAAQAIKSGGTTRRAAKMVVLDADHPEVLDFVRWKRQEERKARVLMAAGFGGGMDGEAFRTVSGQNSNNSVRVTDDFMNRALNKQPWTLRARKNQQFWSEISAHELLSEMSKAAWECADPGIQFHDTIQSWHMCPKAGPIRSSNPCSEYMFLDDSACNLASLNLVRFLKGNDLDWPAFEQCVRLMLLAQDILVDYASYPTARIAENSHCYRPLGLGYANLGAFLMRLGLPYDSSMARQWTAKVTAAMHALALRASAEMAKHYGAFTNWSSHAPQALHVVERHVSAWKNLNLNVPLISDWFSAALNSAAQHGLRNSQVTLLAPTGTIGLFMDCDTLGIEPDFALTKIKTLAGGGSMRLVNASVAPALKRLGYSDSDVDSLVEHVRQVGTLIGHRGLKESHLAVFDTAVPPNGHPQRRVSVDGHLEMMAAAQPFLSGAISKTVNLPASATVEDVEQLFVKAWRLGLKSVALYRDGSKSLQPLCAEC